jgi:hypothetical protein
MSISLNEIRKMVESDIKIDNTQLDKESLNIPQMHNKYLCILMDEKLVLKKYEGDYSILKKNKWLYYTGKLSEEQLSELNWEPFELAILRQDVDKFLDSDKELITLKNKIEYQNEKINYLENIVKGISNRIWNIRAAIDWIKFTQGQ